MGVEPSRLRLIVVTSAALGPMRSHRAVAEAAIEGGATAIQLRAPELTPDEVRPLAVVLAALCRDAGLLFVVNDLPEIAVASQADGAHVGQDDEPGSARQALGAGGVLGVSVGTPADAASAEAMGADYLGVTVWETATKADARPGGIEGLRAVTGATHLPVVGIGGIHAGNARTVLRAGATGVAVISAVAGAPDPVEATRELRAAVDRAIEEEGAA